MATTIKPRPPDFSKFSLEQLPIEISKFKIALKQWHDEQRSEASTQTKPIPVSKNNGIFSVPKHQQEAIQMSLHICENNGFKPINIPIESPVVNSAKQKFIDSCKARQLLDLQTSPLRVSRPSSPLISTLIMNGKVWDPHAHLFPEKAVPKHSFKDYLTAFQKSYTDKYVDKNVTFITPEILLTGSLRVGTHPGLGYKTGIKFNKDGLFVSSTVLVSYEKPIFTYVKSHTARYSTLYQLYIELLKLMLLKESCGGYSIEVRAKQIILSNHISHVVSHLVRPPEVNKASFHLVMKEMEVKQYNNYLLSIF